MPAPDPPVIDLTPVKDDTGATVYKITETVSPVVGAVIGATLAALAGYFIPKIFDRYFEGRDNMSPEWDDEYD